MIRALKRLFHYLLVPNEHNNYRAKVIHHDALTMYFVLGFLLVSLNRYFATPFNNVLGLATDISVPKLYQYTNEQRKNHNVKSLKYSPKLESAAKLKAQNMFVNNYWSHYGPHGETPWQFMSKSGYKYEVAGENLAKNFLFSKNVVTAWMNSPTHRENIVRKDFTEVGYAVQNGTLNGEQTTLVVQMFGRPSSSQAKVLSEFTTAKQTQLPKPLIRLPFTSTQLASGFLIFLVAVFAFDFYIASKLRLVRMHGKSLAHFIFLFAIAIATIFLLSNGSIL